MHDLVLIEKFSSSSDCWVNLEKDKQLLELSVEEILNKYQGFEGDLVAFYKLDDQALDLKAFIEQCIDLNKIGNCLLLHIISEPNLMPYYLKQQAVFVGYDVGIYDEGGSLYSSIFNEILFGGYDELIFYKTMLNKNCLFQDRKTAERYIELHNQMSAEGKNVEDYMDLTIYEIWKHNS